MVLIGFMQNVIPEIYAHGNFLKKQVWNGRPYSTKTYTFIRMKTGNRYGKILMCMRRGMNNKFLLGGMAAILDLIDGKVTGINLINSSHHIIEMRESVMSTVILIYDTCT